jgi:putative transcriptional regulator
LGEFPSTLFSVFSASVSGSSPVGGGFAEACACSVISPDTVETPRQFLQTIPSNNSLISIINSCIQVYLSLNYRRARERVEILWKNTGYVEKCACKGYSTCYRFPLKKYRVEAMGIKQFSDQVKAVRAALNLSQEELAHALGVGFATVNRRENGKTNPFGLSSRKWMKPPNR